MESSSTRENPQPQILLQGQKPSCERRHLERETEHETVNPDDTMHTSDHCTTRTDDDRHDDNDLDADADPHVIASSTASAIGVLHQTQKLLLAHPEAATILENKGTDILDRSNLNLPLHTVCQRGLISLDVVKKWYHAYPQAAVEINKEGLTPFGVFLKRLFKMSAQFLIHQRPKKRLEEEQDEEKEKVMGFLFQVGALQPDVDGKVSLHRVVDVQWADSPLWYKLMAFARMNIQQHPELLFIFDKEGYSPLMRVLSGKVPPFTNRTSPLEFGEIRVLDSINHQILQHEQNMLTRFVRSTLLMVVPSLRARYMEGPSERFCNALKLSILMKEADIVQATYEGAMMAMFIHDEDSTHWDESALYPSSGILKFDVRAHQLRSLTLLSVAFHPDDFLKMIQLVGVRGAADGGGAMGTADLNGNSNLLHLYFSSLSWKLSRAGTTQPLTTHPHNPAPRELFAQVPFQQRINGAKCAAVLPSSNTSLTVNRSNVGVDGNVAVSAKTHRVMEETILELLDAGGTDQAMELNAHGELPIHVAIKYCAESGSDSLLVLAVLPPLLLAYKDSVFVPCRARDPNADTYGLYPCMLAALNYTHDQQYDGETATAAAAVEQRKRSVVTAGCLSSTYLLLQRFLTARNLHQL
jgi:hypothetical protein